MAGQTPAEIIAMSAPAQNENVSASHIRRPSQFLSLAPATSASYPVQRPTSISSPKTSIELPRALAAPETAVVPTAEEIESLSKHRRSSSLSSDGSVTKQRFLKLGPVHFGEDDGKGDWSEVGVAE